MVPMTVAELKAHPAYKHAYWDLKPTKKGKVTVATGRRGGPIKIAYEIHGYGPKHLVWIMGAGGNMPFWQRQTKDFSHEHADIYSGLVLDNRGIGESDAPLSRYSTSEMAKDVIEILDGIGWTSERELHIIGTSMGGMIAQEMGMIIPSRIASMTLCSTSANLRNEGGVSGQFYSRLKRLLVPATLDQAIADAKDRLFNSDFLETPDDEGVLPTNGDRFALEETRKREGTLFPTSGYVGQMIAAGWHFKSSEQLTWIGENVGRHRIQILHGTDDTVVPYSHGKALAKDLALDQSDFHTYEGNRHFIHMESRSRVKRDIEKLIAKVDQMPTQQ